MWNSSRIGRNATVIIAALFILVACEEPKPDNGTFDFSRLAGKWEDASNENHHFEEWQMTNDGILIGKGYVLASEDTVFIENLEIKEVADTMVYVARVSNQNNSEPILFKLSTVEENKVIFENTAHDFPQRIAYEIKSNLELHAYIEGTKGGEFKRTKFFFVRSSPVE